MQQPQSLGARDRAWWGVCEPAPLGHAAAIGSCAHSGEHVWGISPVEPQLQPGNGTAIARHARAIRMVALEWALCGGRGLHLSDLTS